MYHLNSDGMHITSSQAQLCRKLGQKAETTGVNQCSGFLVVTLGFEPGTLHMLGKCCATELNLLSMDFQGHPDLYTPAPPFSPPCNGQRPEFPPFLFKLFFFLAESWAKALTKQVLCQATTSSTFNLPSLHQLQYSGKSSRMEQSCPTLITSHSLPTVPRTTPCTLLSQDCCSSWFRSWMVQTASLTLQALSLVADRVRAVERLELIHLPSPPRSLKDVSAAWAAPILPSFSSHQSPHSTALHFTFSIFYRP